MPALTPALQLSVSAQTDPGRVRPTNQDWWGRFVPSDRHTLVTKGSLFVVADGMGGRAGGQVASRLAVQHLLQAYYHDTTRSLKRSLVQAIRIANQHVYRYGQYYPAYQGMATTLVAVVIRDQDLVVAHVGDSRAYLMRSGRVWPLTRDHSWVAEMVARGVLTPAEAASHPYRHVISRSIGPQPDVQVDVRRTRLFPGDTLVLCTDGLSDLVTPAEIGWAATALPPEHASRTLIEWANRRGGGDNISALVVRAEQPVWRPSGSGNAGGGPLVSVSPSRDGCLALTHSGDVAALLLGSGIVVAGTALALAVLASL